MNLFNEHFRIMMRTFKILGYGCFESLIDHRASPPSESELDIIKNGFIKEDSDQDRRNRFHHAILAKGTAGMRSGNWSHKV